MKRTPVFQYVDAISYQEHFDCPSWDIFREAKRFESDLRRNDPSEPIYVAVVETTRCYGGPEEGGWYYDWSDVKEVLPCNGFRDLLATVRDLRESYQTCQRGRHSVIGGADVTIYMMRHERLVDRLQSKEIPRYE